ncbi:MAG: hypothetical protein AB202_03535, partial [Parcubacteria bacterium C7867-007]
RFYVSTESSTAAMRRRLVLEVGFGREFNSPHLHKYRKGKTA